MKNPFRNLSFDLAAQPAQRKRSDQLDPEGDYPSCRKSWLMEVMRPSNPNGRAEGELFGNTLRPAGFSKSKLRPLC